MQAEQKSSECGRTVHRLAFTLDWGDETQCDLLFAIGRIDAPVQLARVSNKTRHIEANAFVRVVRVSTDAGPSEFFQSRAELGHKPAGEDLEFNDERLFRSNGESVERVGPQSKRRGGRAPTTGSVRPGGSKDLRGKHIAQSTTPVDSRHGAELQWGMGTQFQTHVRDWKPRPLRHSYCLIAMVVTIFCCVSGFVFEGSVL